ncbi:MAG: sugar phosphate nucleotidyltransferase [Promethearchaeota archaeon]
MPLIICPMAGLGKRLQPLTLKKPKALLPLAGKLIIDHILTKIQEIAPKDSRICFITGHKRTQLETYITDNYKHFFKLSFIEQPNTTSDINNPKYSGLGDAVSLASPWGKGKDCLIVLSDRLPMGSFAPLIQMAHENSWDGIINVSVVKDPQHYGICEVNETGLIHIVVEKPHNPKSHLAISGAYYFRSNITRSLFSKLQKQADKPFDGINEHQITGIIQQLIQEGAKIGVHINPPSMPIFDLGRAEKMLEANRKLLQNNIAKESIENDKSNEDLAVPNNATLLPYQVKNSEIIEPVYIGKGSLIENSKIGPFVSLGNNCRISNSILSNGIGGNSVIFENKQLDNFLLGEGTTNATLLQNGILLNSNQK